MAGEKGTTYEDAGIHNATKADVSRILYEAAKKTWGNRKGKFGEILVPADSFSGIREFDVSGLPKGTRIGGCADGIGTKVEIAQRMNKHSTMAFNLIAMACDDAPMKGGEPFTVLSVLDTNSLVGPKPEERPFLKEAEQIAAGYVAAANAAGVAILTGETAELRHLVGGFGDFHYNWAAAALYIAREGRRITGKEVKPGDVLVGLRENGLRSNGISLATKVLAEQYGENWHNTLTQKGYLGELALSPAIIYCKAVVDMFGGYDGEQKAEIHGVAHITGEGMPGKVRRMLEQTGLGANIYDPFEPCWLMTHCQKIGNVTDETAYNTWNMGVGMAVATPQPEAVIAVAKSHGIEAKVIGNVTEDRAIMIANKGFYRQRTSVDVLKF